MNRDAEYFTEEGLQKANAKLEELKSRLLDVGRVKSEAAAGGNWHDNAVFEEMTREEYKLYRMIAELEEHIRRAKVIEAPDSNTCIQIGSYVKLKFEDEEDVEEYFLVGPMEADPSKQRISFRSPLGSAILGAKVGECVDYQIEGGRTGKVTIVSISAM